MSHRGRAVLAAAALVLVVVIGWLTVGRGPGVPTVTMPHAPNELDIDLAAGTPMPLLPTAVPDGWSITTAEQALVAGLRGGRWAAQPKDITVRLLNKGIINRLCGGDGSGPMPEEDLTWAVAYTQDGLDTKIIAGSWYNRQPPLLWLELTPDKSLPTPTPVPSPTPERVAGVLIAVYAVEGWSQIPGALFDPNAGGRLCPTLAMIRAKRSLPDVITPMPTALPVTPMPTVMP